MQPPQPNRTMGICSLCAKEAERSGLPPPAATALFDTAKKLCQKHYNQQYREKVKLAHKAEIKPKTRRALWHKVESGAAEMSDEGLISTASYWRIREEIDVMNPTVLWRDEAEEVRVEDAPSLGQAGTVAAPAQRTKNKRPKAHKIVSIIERWLTDENPSDEDIALFRDESSYANFDDAYSELDSDSKAKIDVMVKRMQIAKNQKEDASLALHAPDEAAD